MLISDINECLPNGGRGLCAQICTNTIGSFQCSCQPGYNVSGYDCNGMHNEVSITFCFKTLKQHVQGLCYHLFMRSCFSLQLDINECLPNGGSGPCEQICTNSIGSFSCSCLQGFSQYGYTCHGNVISYKCTHIITTSSNTECLLCTC